MKTGDPTSSIPTIGKAPVVEMPLEGEWKKAITWGLQLSGLTMEDYQKALEGHNKRKNVRDRKSQVIVFAHIIQRNLFRHMYNDSWDFQAFGNSLKNKYLKTEIARGMPYVKEDEEPTEFMYRLFQLYEQKQKEVAEEHNETK